MSSGQLARDRSLSLGSGHSIDAGPDSMSQFSMPLMDRIRDFEPCAATASMFLYAQGNSVVCAHHDTLAIERRFLQHTEEITLLAVDTISDKGNGRLVLSYDVGQTCIVWDLMTGVTIQKFSSFSDLTAAAWMRNGNACFGNSQGEVTLFEPSTNEHLSARTLDQIPVTSIAPAADCRTYAIGYQNGSLLIATLQPRFTILHNLTTSRGPSPIVTLAWHSSSSKQKSDMLATQTKDGDVRVWSVTKSPTSSDTAKVVRILRRSENYQPGANWLGWSKNGRIVQYSEGETSSWDVRTKHVTYENVPTLEHVRGLAIYGPGATLFTLGPNNTAQQFDLSSTPQIVTNVQHPANVLPPSPPVSIEEQKNQKNQIESAARGPSSVPVNIDVSESDEDHMSPLERIAIAREMDNFDERPSYEQDRGGALSPVSQSSRSQASASSVSSAGSRSRRKHSSVVSRGMSEATSMSFGSSLHTAREPSVASSRDSFSMRSTSSVSNTSSHRSRTRPSRLRQEVLLSPEEKQVVELFKFTKMRLSDIPYRNPQVPDNARLTNDDLRRQMLSTIFGWDGEVDAMISDEMRRHPAGSSNALLLAKWLGDIDTDVMATSSESMTSSDWMLLALSGIGGLASQHKVARAYVQRLLEKGDVHTAATIMIGMGDQNDAIEIYVSHKRYMEALILTSLVFPSDWQRQTDLIRKWGEWAVQHGQQQLAIRCFSCTASEPTEPWSSPGAQAATFSSQMHAKSIPEILSPPLSPPGAYGPQRNMAKTSALKLITTFGDQVGKSKFFGGGEDERTPVGGLGVTPIAESALSPGGGDTAHTAFLRPSHRSAYNTPASARTATPGGFRRQRLPSIGERDNEEPTRLPTPADSGSDAELNLKLAHLHERTSSQPETLNSATYQPISRTSTASPMVQKGKLLPEGSNALPSPSPESFTIKNQDLRARNGSRDRKPDGLQIQWPPMESIITGDYMSPQNSASSSSRRRPTTAKSVAESATGSVTGSVSSMSSYGRYDDRSPLPSGNSYRSLGNASPVVTGRSLDQYISSLESAQHHSHKQRSRPARSDKLDDRQRSASRKAKTREPSEDRGRSNARYIKPAKRSPTSPIPMSPEDLRVLGAEGFGDEPYEKLRSPISEARTRGDSQITTRAASKSSRIRRQSPEPVRTKPSSRAGSRNASRRPSPGRLTLTTLRGRSKGREGSVLRSPSSPLPMSPQARLYQADDEDYEPPQRLRSRQRSTSRLRDRGTSAVRGLSPEHKSRQRSSSRRPATREASRSRELPEPSPRRDARDPSQNRSTSDQKRSPSFLGARSERALKKEQAARELEERRMSLARRPSAPSIIHPEDLASLSPTHERSTLGSPFLLKNTFSGMSMPTRSQTTSPESSRISPSFQREREAARVSPAKVTPPYNQSREGEGSPSLQIGLPATPRAMRHPKYDPDGKEVPDVPQIPESYASSGSPPRMGSLKAMTFDGLGPLPKTTYQASARQIPRSMSAPIPEEPPSSPHALPAALPTHPAFQAALPPSSLRRQNSRASALPPVRKIAPGNSQPGMLGYETRNNIPVYSHSAVTMVGIEETIEANKQPINPSNNNLTPPPPPPLPAPPILKELQHLAMPPPPPPAPLYYPHNSNTMSINSGVSLGSGVSGGSGVIEIVMDDDDEPNSKHHSNPRNLVIEIPQPPPEPRSRAASISSHNRGRSFNDKDNSITGRISRATERMRSASRGRSTNNSPLLNRTTKSPTETSPYESVLPPTWNGGGEHRNVTPGVGIVTERHPREVAATYAKEGNPFEDHGGMI